MSADATLGPSAREGRSFHVHSCLGRGGFGEVYRATMVSTGGVRSEVAIKVLHVDVEPDSQAVRRLRDEGRLLGAVRHPAVLRVHDLVLLHERVALVTEYVEGADLDKCLQNADPMPLRGLVEVIGRVAAALDAAFVAQAPSGGTLNLIHRDIKPANIRIGRHGEVKLLDFGIARAANVEREARTETHAMLGSYLYMAPERFLDGRDSGPAVDVFSLGCTLYEGIAGQRLFGELSLKDLYLLVLEESKYDTFINDILDQLLTEVPSEVLQLLVRMLELKPERRPSEAEVSRTCYDMADRLPGKALDRWARERKWPRQRRVKGMLDGKVIVETASGSDVYDDVVLPEPDADPIAAVATSAVSMEAGALWPPRAGTSLSATFERPRPLLVGAGLLSISTVSAVVVVLLGLVVVMAGQVWPTLSQRGARPAAVAPAPVAASTPAAPTPTPDPGIDVADPGTGGGAEPPATPEASADPVRPEPVKGDAEAVVIPVRPPPAPPLQSKPSPAEPPQEGMVSVDASVLVTFHNRGGRVQRAGRVPVGTYEVHADFGDGMQPTGATFNLSASQALVVRCSKFTRSCEVDY